MGWTVASTPLGTECSHRVLQPDSLPARTRRRRPSTNGLGRLGVPYGDRRWSPRLNRLRTPENLTSIANELSAGQEVVPFESNPSAYGELTSGFATVKPAQASTVTDAASSKSGRLAKMQEQLWASMTPHLVYLLERNHHQLQPGPKGVPPRQAGFAEHFRGLVRETFPGEEYSRILGSNPINFFRRVKKLAVEWKTEDRRSMHEFRTTHGKEGRSTREPYRPCRELRKADQRQKVSRLAT